MISSKASPSSSSPASWYMYCFICIRRLSRCEDCAAHGGRPKASAITVEGQPACGGGASGLEGVRLNRAVRREKCSEAARLEPRAAKVSSSSGATGRAARLRLDGVEDVLKHRAEHAARHRVVDPLRDDLRQFRLHAAEHLRARPHGAVETAEAASVGRRRASACAPRESSAQAQRECRVGSRALIVPSERVGLQRASRRTPPRAARGRCSWRVCSRAPTGSRPRWPPQSCP